MSLKKNFYDKDVSTKNLVTTITGIVTLVITILSSFGILTPEQSTELTVHAGGLIGAVNTIVGIVAAIILMFKAKDA